MMPESPRWLEGKGRVEAADRIVTKWETQAEARFGPLPRPTSSSTPSSRPSGCPPGSCSAARYRATTLLLLAVWFFGYSGLVYGGASFFPTWAVAHGWSAHELFFFSRILAAPIGIVVFFLVAAFGERYERKTWMLVSSILYSICFLLLFAFPHSFAAQALLIRWPPRPSGSGCSPPTTTPPRPTPPESGRSAPGGPTASATSAPSSAPACWW